jgi:hypothetical protein
MMNRVLRWMLGAVILAILFGTAMPSSYAQNAAGRIVGTVTDQTGATIQGANVTVTNLATQISQQTTTGGDGFYQLLNLPIGRYRVTIEKDGFQQQVFDGQTLQISQSLRLDAQLSIYQTKQVIEVKEQANDVETVNATVGGTVTGAAIQQAPLNGRNVLDLAKLQPGVTETNPDSGAAGTVSIAGGRTDSVTFLLDGGLNNDLLSNGVVFNPNPDTVEEFRVLESNYSAEYGRNAGGIISDSIRLTAFRATLCGATSTAARLADRSGCRILSTARIVSSFSWAIRGRNSRIPHLPALSQYSLRQRSVATFRRILT